VEAASREAQNTQRFRIDDLEEVEKQLQKIKKEFKKVLDKRNQMC